MLPEAVKDEIICHYGSYMPLADLASLARHFDRNRPRRTAYMAEEVTRRRGTCDGCGGSHLLAACPDRAIQCRKCRRIGHRALNCKNHVVPDQAGKPRVVLGPNAKGIFSQILTDKSATEQIDTMKRNLDLQLQKIIENRQRQREKRVKDMDDGQIRERKERVIMSVEIITDDEEDDEFDQEADCVVIENVPDEMEFQTYSCYHAEAKQGIKQVCGTLAGRPCLFALDDCSSFNVISDKFRRNADVALDPQRQPIRARGIGGSVSLPWTLPITITLGGSLSTPFAVSSQPETPTLISFATQRSLGLITDLSKMTVKIGGSELQICYELEDGAHKEEKAAIEAKLEHLRNDMSPSELNTCIDAFMKHRYALFGQAKGTAQVAPLQITLRENYVPRRFNSRPLSEAHFQKVSALVNELILSGAAEKVTSCTSISPIHLVIKPPRKDRMVIDYRHINDGIPDDPHPLPHIQDLQKVLSRYAHITTVDLKHGFHNIPIEESTKELTGFSVPRLGVFRFNVLPFGWKVAPTLFQRAMEEALSTELAKGNTHVFIDDIGIGGNDLETHLQQVLSVAQQGFAVNWEKCQIAKRSVKYLGHVISKEGMEADPDKVAALLDACPPKSRKDLKTFICAAAYLRCFIPDFATIAQPLHNKCLEKGSYVWTDVDDGTYQRLKYAIPAHVMLSAADPDLGYDIYTDASDIGVGAALTQAAEPNGEQRRYLAFASKAFSKVQRNWDTTDREVFAVMWALETFATFVKGATVKIFTDHKPLTHLTTTTKPKLLRYALRICEFSPQIYHVNGESNELTDWLSRTIPDDGEPDVGYALATAHSGEENHQRAITVRALLARTLEEGAPSEVEILDGVARHAISGKLYVPKALRERILYLTHGSR